jgi:hypothetical protein
MNFKQENAKKSLEDLTFDELRELLDDHLINIIISSWEKND